MSSLLHRFVSRTQFDSYEDFAANFEIRVPENFNFAYDVVDVYAREEPNKRAMVWCDDNGESRTFTFADMKYYSDKAANVFRAAGIGKGDHVMLVLKGRFEFWFCVLGLHKIGAVACPATHMLTRHDFEYRIESAGIRMVVTVNENGLPEYVDQADETRPGILRVKAMLADSRDGWLNFSEELVEASADFERPTGAGATTNDDVSMLYFSSGTTGYPKMITHNFVYPLGHIMTAGYWQNVMDDGLHYTVADTGWAKCVWGKLYGQWLCGSAVFVYDYERFHAADMIEKTIAYGVTTFCAPPTIYRFLIREDLSRYDFSNLKYAVVAGEPLNPEVYERFRQLTGLRLMEGYGQTETCVLVATFAWMNPKPGSMGKPTPGWPLELINGDGKLCEVGEEGELVINTSKGIPLGMFTGYYRDAGKVAETWYDGYYHTGDMAWKDEDGYFWFVGRTDDLIKSSGYRIGPFEVESALIEHAAVLECAITGVPDPLRGQVVKATIVLNKGYVPSDDLIRELQQHVRNVTAPYKYPRIVEFVDVLPKTISGKIRRVEIREHDTSQKSS